LQWHIGHYAYLLDKLKGSSESTGNVLDNAAIVFTPEAGHGRHLNTPSDTVPKTHSVEDMVLLVGGRIARARLEPSYSREVTQASEPSQTRSRSVCSLQPRTAATLRPKLDMSIIILLVRACANGRRPADGVWK
jgi:hypothetical protein